MACLFTPPAWVQVQGFGLKPIIVNVVPAIKMDSQAVLVHFCYSGCSHHGRVPFVDCFELLFYFKTGQRSLKQRKRNENNLLSWKICCQVSMRSSYRISSMKQPGRQINFWTLAWDCFGPWEWALIKFTPFSEISNRKNSVFEEVS